VKPEYLRRSSNKRIKLTARCVRFAPDLVEFIDHGAGTEVRIGNKHLVRDVSGEWSEVSGSNPPLKLGFIHRLMRSFRGRR
jgi:hypothetical protein